MRYLEEDEELGEEEMDQEALDDLRRLEELLRFVDEFLMYGDLVDVPSLTYVEQRKPRVYYNCKCKECWIKPKVVLTPSGLVRKQKRLYKIKERLERIIKDRNVGKIRKKQEEAVRIIRDKIAEARRAYWCHKKERELEKAKKRERVLDELRKLFHFDEKFINAASACVTKVLVYRKIRRFSLRARKQRTVDIVRKILLDLVTPKQIKRALVAEIGLRDYVAEEEEELLGDDVEMLTVQPLVPFQPGHPIKHKSSQTEVEPEPVIEKVYDFLPRVPIINPRRKCAVGAPADVDDLLDAMSKVPALYKERLCYGYSMKLLEGIEYETDRSFRIDPETITFQSFENDKVYTKKIRVCNGGTVTKRCMFKRFKVDEAVSNQFDAEIVGIQLVLPGMSFEMSIRFLPKEVVEVARGSAIFLTYSPRSRTFLQFGANILCLPLCSSIGVKPKSIAFDPTPIWEAKASSIYKTLTINNLNVKSCLIAIVKVEEFEDVEGYLNDHFEEAEEEGGPYECSGECIVCGEDNYLQELLIGWSYGAGAFFFDVRCLALPPHGKKTVKVFFRNPDYVGSYFEDYRLALFEDLGEKVKCVGSYDIPISAEVTGNFIEVDPLTIDFRVCVFNSVYHSSFTISNRAQIPHLVGVKFPSSLKKMLWSDAHDVMIQGLCTNTYNLKFVPRREILLCERYYDHGTRILEFPIRVSVLSKKFLTVPPCNVIVVAVITEDNGVSLSCSDVRFMTYFHACCDADVCDCESHAEYVIDLGNCTTAEAVYTDLKITNNSYVFQVFGFVNLPPCLQIMPNYGFGELLPLETKTLTLYYNPEVKDIPNYDVECQDADLSMAFSIKVETLKSLSGIEDAKPKFTLQVLKKLVDIMEREMSERSPWSLLGDVYQLVDLLREKNLCIVPEMGLSTGTSDHSYSFPDLKSSLDGPCPSLDLVVEEEEVEHLVIKNNRISVKATIVDPLCDFSHQYVEFPDTPCGSYSIMTIDLKAHTCIANAKCLCYYKKKYGKCKDPLSYKAHFEIVGNSQEFSVEPDGGSMQAGQTTKLYVIARPELSKNHVMDTAKRLKKEELMLRKMEAWRLKCEKKEAEAMAAAAAELTSVKKKPKKKTEQKKKKSPREKEEAPPSFEVADREVVIGRGDLYRAEMESWKHMDPYVAKAQFCCTVSYISKDFKRDREKLYFETRCFVVRPSFIHNLQSQHVAFGAVSLIEPERRIIALENISDAPIYPVVSALSPSGFFTVPYLPNLALQPDHVLHLPLTCTPDAPNEVIEFFEIRAGSTIYSLKASARGSAPNFTITPSALVFRLEAKSGKFVECPLEINNKAECALPVDFVKVCELEGEVEPAAPTPSSAKIKSATKKKKSKKKKVQKFSNSLSEKELDVIGKLKKNTGEPYFKLSGASENDCVRLKPKSKAVVRLVFGELSKIDDLNTKDKKKRKKNKKKKKSQKSSKSNKSSKSEKTKAEPKHYYVVKYNLVMGSSATFIKDIIIIGTFQ